MLFCKLVVVCLVNVLSTDPFQMRDFDILTAAVWTINRQGADSKWHDDVIKWKHFPRYWPFVRGIHQSPVNCPHKGQWRGVFFDLRLNKQLSKQWWGWWFETLSRVLWRQCYGDTYSPCCGANSDFGYVSPDRSTLFKMTVGVSPHKFINTFGVNDICQQ